MNPPALRSLPAFGDCDVLSISVNGAPRSIERQRNSIADLIRGMKLEGKRIAVEHNGAIVSRSRYAETLLADGDTVEIVGAVGGG